MMAKTQYVHIENVCKEIFAGGDVPKNALSYVKTEEYCVPIFSNGEKDNGLYGYTNHARVNEPSITVSARGTIGYTSKRCEPFFPVVRLITLTPEDDVIDLDYLFYATQNYKFEGSGTSIPQLTVPMLKKYAFPLPELEEQKAIAKLFQKLDCLISLRKQQLAKLDELVKARFVEMFGEPSSNPMGWLQTTVGAECYYIKDGPHKSLTDVGMENGYPFISVRNIVNGYIDFSTAKYISEADYKDAIKKCCPEKGDILYSKGGTTGIAKLVDIDIKFANWVHLAVLKFNRNEFNGSFFEKMLNCDYCYKQSQMLTKGIANRDLVLSAIAQIKIYKPPILFQNQFAAFVERVDQQKQTVQQSLEKLELMKKALMQEYLG